MRVTSKGQVTIPIDLRERLGILPHTEVEFVEDAGGVRIVKSGSDALGRRGKMAVEKLLGRATVGYSTDDIMALTRD